jgi:PAS domain S-box-containing protein
MILVTAAAYYVTGRIGLALAIPPGYATVVWPPAGIALAAVVLGGYRNWPGVMLGSFLVNFEPNFQSVAPLQLLSSLALPMAISAAAALQAVVGAWLLKRFKAFPYAPVDPLSVGRMFFFGGVVATLTNSTLANLILLLLGRLTVAEAPLDWATWWSGDAIGVFVCSPVIMTVYNAPAGERWRRATPIAAAMLVALAATTALFVVNAQLARRAMSTQLGVLTHEFANRVETTLRLGTNAVGGLAGVFESASERDLVDFQNVAKRLVAFGLGIQAIEWIPKVPDRDKRDFETQVAGQWKREFAIFDRVSGRPAPVASRPAYFPVTYVYPLQGNEGALGFDLASSPDRNAYLLEAEASGMALATSGVKLVQNGKTGILLFVPVFEPTMTGTSNALKGFALGVFAVPDLLNVALQGRDTADLVYSVVDETDSMRPTILSTSGDEHADTAANAQSSLLAPGALLASSARIEFAGRTWSFRMAPTAAYVARHTDNSAYYVLLGGLLFTAFLSGCVMVVTDRQRQMVAAREKELEDQKFALDQHAIVSIADASGTILYANDRFCQIAGYAREQLIGARHTIINSGRHDASFFAEMWATIQAGKVWHGEICNRNSAGTFYWLHSTVVPLLDRDGRAAQFIAICTDITARKRLEHDLESSRAFLQSVTDSMGEGVYTLDASGNCTFLNAEAERLVGWTADEVRNRPLHDIVHFQDRDGAKIAAHDCAIMSAVRSGRKYHSEDQYFTHRDGRIFPVSVVSVQLEEAGQFVGSVTVFQDITKRLRFQEELQKSEERLSIALSASTTGLWDYNPTNDQAIYSDTWYTMLGYAPGALPADGATFYSLMHPDDLMAYRTAIAVHAEGGQESMEVEFRMRRNDQSWAWIKSVGKVIERDEHSLPTRLVGVHIDVSRAHQAQSELAKAKDAAEQANQAKSAFLATMSHEIRTPMNAIIGLAHLMGRTELSRQQRDYLGKIQTSSQSLLEIINDILDFSKIEAGKLRMETVEFNIDDILKKLSMMIGPKIREKALELVIVRAPTVPSQLVGDPLRLSQIFMNLMSNAAKFTERGEVVVTVGGHATDDGRFMIEASVVDTGIGMSAAQLAALFLPFAQADDSISRRFGGTGLGLAITRQLANLFGGKIEVESVEGVGSTFRFSAPFGIAASAERTEASFVGKRALIVDDSPTVRGMLVETLQRLGVAAQTAASGAQALELTSGPVTFDIIILDWKMPDMDGVQTMRRLRAAGVDAPVVLAGSLGREALEQAIVAEFGAVDATIELIEKPIMPSSLIERMRFAFGLEERRQNDPTALNCRAADAALSNANVLLIEDNAINQQVAAELLAALGVRTTIAGSGEEALDILRARRFDLILMDIQMPGMDGFATTAAIRSQLRIATTPIIAVTANAMVGERERCVEAGMNDHIAKPIDPDVLALTLRRWFGPIDAGDPRLGALAPAEPVVDAPMLGVPGVDIGAALRHLDGNQSLLMRLLRTFAIEHADDAADLRKAAAELDLPLVNRIAHRLKGAALTLGAAAVARIAAEIESLTANERPAEASAQIARSIDTLSLALDEVREGVAASPPQPAEPIPAARSAPSPRPPAHRLLPLVDSLFTLLAEGNSDAEKVSEQIVEMLVHTGAEERAEEVARLTARFDFDDARSALTQLRAEIS